MRKSILSFVIIIFIDAITIVVVIACLLNNIPKFNNKNL